MPATAEGLKSGQVRPNEAYFKKLDFITPDYAAELRQVVTQPVFISEEPTGAVVYRMGEVTRAVNLDRRTGGIYYDVGVEGHVDELRRYAPKGSNDMEHSQFTSSFKMNGWVALVEPVGETLNTPRDENYQWHRRGEAVNVKEVMAFCHGCELGPLQEGYVLNRGNQWLVPLCTPDNHPGFFKEPTEEAQRDGYRQIEMPKWKFTINPETGFTLVETEVNLTEGVLSPSERIVISKDEPKDLWKLVQRAGRRFTPDNARPISPVPLAVPSIVLKTENRGLSITTFNEKRKELGDIGGNAEEIYQMVMFGMAASKGDRLTLKGHRFPASFNYFLERTEAALVIQPAEFYYDYQAEKWDARTPYPVVLHQDELPQIATFANPQNFQ